MTTITKPKPITEDDFLTIPEIAFMTGMERGTVERWRIRNRGTDKAFLEPDDYIGSVPVWRLRRVVAWLDKHNRAHDVSAWRQRREEGGFRRQA